MGRVLAHAVTETRPAANSLACGLSLTAASGFARSQSRTARLPRASPSCPALAASVGFHGHGDYDDDRHDAPGLSDFDVGGVDPQVRPVTFKGAINEGVHAFIELAGEP